MDNKIENLENLVEELSNSIATSIFQSINMLASIVTLLEKSYEGSHSRFVAEKSSELAEAMGYKDTDVFEIKTAGLLHDLGKVGFKDTLLFKFTTEMNQSEMREYMLHPEMGMRILSHHSGFNNIGEMIMQHHERIDGSGFPKRLQFNNINPGALILSVVDTYHNLMFKKNRDKVNTVNPVIKYSSAAAYIDSTKDRFASAMNYLHQKKGIFFDKNVVDKFTDIVHLERAGIGKRTVMRVLVNQVEPGMIFAEDYYTNYGLLIAAKGERVKKEMVKHLLRFSESGDIPNKILILK